MSSKEAYLYNSEFDTYNDAISKVLKDRGLKQKWIIEKIIEPGQKVESLQSMMSRWLSKGDPVSAEYQEKINAALDIEIEQAASGKWEISRTEPRPDRTEEPRPEYGFTIDELLKEERSRLGIEDLPDTEQGRALQDILDDAVSLVLKLRRLIEKEMAQRENPQWQEDHSQWWHPIYWILLARLGVRPSELLAVRVDHVRDGEILVRKGSRGKSQAARRRVPVIGVETRAALDVLTSPKFRQMDRIMAGSDLLFGRDSRASLDRASAEFREAVAAAVPSKKDFKMRDLRNTWAYWFLTRDRSKDSDFARYQLKRIMGHSTSKMSDYYMDTLPYNPDLGRLHHW